jgi:glycine oxidase
MNIGIAGAGLLGRLLAHLLTQQGHAVSVFDPADAPAARGAAAWTAAGMLSPTAELECADMTVFQYGLRSIRRWAEIVPTLPTPVTLTCAGSLLLAHRPDTGAAQRTIGLLAQKAPPDHRPQAISPDQLKELEPDVRGPTQSWLLPHEAQIDTVEAMRALYAGARTAGWHWNAGISDVMPGTLCQQDRKHAFDHVFDVRGAGARSAAPIDPAEISCSNVRGVRGEIFWLHAPGVELHRPLRLLHPRHRVYLVPRRDNIIIVGATEIESEDRSSVSLRSTVELLAAAHSVMPGLAEARVVHSETNLRPALIDNLPRIEHESGLTRINGLFRHGWLMAPALVDDALAHVFSTPNERATIS